MTGKTNMPANDAERAALDHWRNAHPAKAMQTLADAGYTWPGRVQFLHSVVGLPRYAACEYADLQESLCSFPGSECSRCNHLACGWCDQCSPGVPEW